jgi:hypothetical protein
MPLSKPAPRKPIHTRQVVCKGYEREDGLWDIEGHLVDTKAVPHARRHGGTPRKPGEPVHEMWLRLTIDLDMVVHDAEAVTDTGPHPTCGDITVNFKRLIGLQIGPGWRKEIRARVGGVEGCTHIVEMLGPLGTTAFQATGRAREERNAGKPITKKPYQIGSCHIYKEDSPAVMQRWPQWAKKNDEVTK